MELSTGIGVGLIVGFLLQNLYHYLEKKKSGKIFYRNKLEELILEIFKCRNVLPIIQSQFVKKIYTEEFNGSFDQAQMLCILYFNKCKDEFNIINEHAIDIHKILMKYITNKKINKNIEDEIYNEYRKEYKLFCAEIYDFIDYIKVEYKIYL